MGRFELEAFLKAIEKHRVTNMWSLPPIMLAQAKQSVVSKYDLSSLKYIGLSVAPLVKELMEECARRLPHVTIFQVIVCIFSVN
ncbi:AMP-dependent synthetase/ligase [Sesbania bispinosa]|nr:AMP-dependent synthetase/ligase [Sesbania bispinosa]